VRKASEAMLLVQDKAQHNHMFLQETLATLRACIVASLLQLATCNSRCSWPHHQHTRSILQTKPLNPSHPPLVDPELEGAQDEPHHEAVLEVS
jgi:hypothetical protein